MRDITFNLFSFLFFFFWEGGRSTITCGLTWFFWLISTHPFVEAKIIEEIKMLFLTKEERKNVWCLEVVNNLDYLHVAICETLRPFPPIPWERKEAMDFDVLPSGHRINPNKRVLYFLYSMEIGESMRKRLLGFQKEEDYFMYQVTSS